MLAALETSLPDVLVGADDFDDPRYAGIVQLVACLVEAGNTVLDAGFHLSDIGWTCKLAQPIDFTLLRSTFAIEAAEQLVLNDWLDEVWDHNTWASIEGPVCALRARELPAGVATTHLFAVQSGFAGSSDVEPRAFTFEESLVNPGSLVSVA